ncbi:MAG: type IV secretory system conjugative DNA transfer family protein [Candidatus Uhrbacteria bacterium]|nr:type IV secretion system DNA-binding domain-containing protein [Patescibacteria group bacterium]MBU1907467.1 type IV secretion system DNA-binding domain-containing protein [Patescibacteria group bacterium]
MKLAQAQFGLTDSSASTVAQTAGVPSALIDFLPLIIGVIAVVAALVAALFIARAVIRRRVHSQGGAFDRIVVLVMLPRFKSQEETKKVSAQEIQEEIADAETFFSSLGGMTPQKGLKHWFLGRTDEMAFEIVLEQGLIKFYYSIPRSLQQFVEEQLFSQYPDAHIEIMEDYNIFSPTGQIVGAYLTFKRPVVFPIKTYKKLDNDPLDGLTNALSKIPEDSGVAIQYVVRSARPDWRQRGLKIAQDMQQGTKLDDAVAGKKKGKKGGMAKDLLGGSEKQDQQKPDEPYRLSPLEEEAVKGLEEKASKAGLAANIRVIVSSETSEKAQMILSNVLGAFAQYNIYQFGNKFEKSVPGSKKQLVRDFIYRSFDDKYRIVLNAEEMASMWHLPLPTTETPNIHWMGARRSAAPTTIPKEGLFLGTNEYRGVKTKIHIKRADRQRHMYIIGKSGSGKSVFMRNMIIQDIKNGEGVCVVDPHGDLVESVLGHIPKERVDDVIIFAPGDLERPMGLNMLEVKSADQADFAVQEMIAIFYQLFPPEMIGPMFEHNMRNVMLTLMSDPDNPGTIAEIPRMFSDQPYADEWIKKVKDPVVRAYWEKEMAQTSDFHKSEMLGYLISKVGRFVGNEMMRNIIGQSHSAFDFRDVMDNKKILMVNLSKGKVGEINSKLLGMIIVSKLQMAAMGRADMPEEERNDFYLYMDEFQNFVTGSIATILSEARKYRLDLIMAHQYLGQLVSEGGKTEVRDAVLGNAGTMLVCRIGVDDTEVLAKEFEPVFSGYDLVNADKYTWYTKMIVDNSTQKPFTMKGPWTEKGDPELAAAIKELSRLKYGRDKSIVIADIMERTQLGSTESGAPPAIGERQM